MTEALLAAAGALVTALVAAVVVLLKERHKIRQTENTSAVRDYKAIVDRLEKQADRHGRQIDSQQEAIRHLYAAESRCRVELATVYGCLVAEHHRGNRHAAALRRLGPDHDPGPDPDLPDRPDLDGPGAEAEFVKRSAEQNARLAKEVDRQAVEGE